MDSLGNDPDALAADELTLIEARAAALPAMLSEIRRLRAENALYTAALTPGTDSLRGFAVAKLMARRAVDERLPMRKGRVLSETVRLIEQRNALVEVLTKEGQRAWLAFRRRAGLGRRPPLAARRPVRISRLARTCGRRPRVRRRVGHARSPGRSRPSGGPDPLEGRGAAALVENAIRAMRRGGGAVTRGSLG